VKIIKRIILIFFILIAICFLFRGGIYRHLVSYKSIGQRMNYPVTDKQLIEIIEKNISKNQDNDVRQLIKLSLRITSEQLNFTVSKNDVDPNKLIYSKTAHCVGYASFCSTTCNYLFDKFKMDDTWMAKPQVGHLYFLGINIHPYFHSFFFKDHDFVIVENKRTHEKIVIDPTINDYLFIDFVTLHQ